MSASFTQAGVCIVRVESQEGFLLITVTTNRALNRNLYSVTAEHVAKFSDPERVLEAVAEFLGSYRTVNASASQLPSGLEGAPGQSCPGAEALAPRGSGSDLILNDTGNE
jgi:hypothetical protein